MEKIPYENRLKHGEQYTANIYVDYVNERVRVDDYRGNSNCIIKQIHDMAKEKGFTKIIVKARHEHWQTFLSHGYMLEGIFKGYFNGNDAYSMALYLSDERRTSRYWMEEDHILQQILDLPGKMDKPLPNSYNMRMATIQDAKALAKLYGEVFKVYPTPMNEEKYIQKVMKDGTIFYVIESAGKIVSAASAEVNGLYHNAEMTDCATLPEHRKHGFMKILIQALEQELMKKNIYCVYSLSRALSFGMNAVFRQLGYEYTGRLSNNCYIFDKMEDMNLWVKDLAKLR